MRPAIIQGEEIVNHGLTILHQIDIEIVRRRAKQAIVRKWFMADGAFCFARREVGMTAQLEGF